MVVVKVLYLQTKKKKKEKVEEAAVMVVLQYHHPWVPRNSTKCIIDGRRSRRIASTITVGIIIIHRHHFPCTKRSLITRTMKKVYMVYYLLLSILFPFFPRASGLGDPNSHA
jgi:hypothetical protein